MARLNPSLLAFNAGEVSKIALARVDVAKMRVAADCQLNWLPRVIGPMMLRPGLQFIGELSGSNVPALVPFVFSKLDTALLELTPNEMRVRIDDVLVTRAVVTTVIADPNFTTGTGWVTAGSTAGGSVNIGAGVCTFNCSAVGALAKLQTTILVSAGDRGKEHGLRVVITNGPVTLRAGSAAGLSDVIPQTVLDTGTHSLAFTPQTDVVLQIESTDLRQKTLTQVTIDAAGPLTLPTPWGVFDLANLRWDQSGDIIFLACYGLQQRKIERRAKHGWSVVLYRSDNGPFRSGPSVDANLAPTVTVGNGSLTADRPFFQVGHVGALFRLFSGGQSRTTDLAGQNAFAAPIRVSGVGTTARNYAWAIQGTWSGTLTFQRSFDGPDSGFVDVSTMTGNGSINSSTGGSGGTPPLDNIVCWERLGFKAGEYVSGIATVAAAYNGGGGYGICRVTGISSSQLVSMEVLQPFSSLQPTKDWAEAEWSGALGWPTSVAFHEGRLCWLGRDHEWFSGSDDYTGFAEIDGEGQPVGDAGPINIVFGSGPVDTVSWGLSLSRFLAGREQSIASTRASNFDQPLTPTAIVVRDCSDQGAERLKAVKAGKRGLFVQQSGRRVYELFFDPGQSDYSERDLTRLNLDIGRVGFADIAMQTQPDKMLWMPRNNGQCAALLYEPDDEVVGWWRMQTLGIIERVCVLPGAGIEDTVYFAVRRVVNGVTRRFLEKLAPRDRATGGLINQMLDCHLVYEGAATPTVQLSWLPSTKVLVWADGAFLGEATTSATGICTMPDGEPHSFIVVGLGGAVKTYSGPATSAFAGLSEFEGLTAEVFADQQPSGRMRHAGAFTVAGGVIALPSNWQATRITACIGYVAPFMSAKLAYSMPGAAPVSRKKKIDHVGLLLFDLHAQGLALGQRFDKLDDLPAIVEGGEVEADTVWAEYDERMVEVPGQWDTDARLCLLAQAPLPCTVAGVVVAME